MGIQAATEEEIRSFLGSSPNWSRVEDKLYREYHFADFIQAFGFMTQAALVIEKQNHHPEWCNAYRTVVVYLSTHEVGGISERDFRLASSLDGIAASLVG